MAARMARVQFGVFEVDEAAGELRRQGRRVHLAPQPFRMLELLISRPGIIVTRDELQHHLWNDGTFVEFDRSLNFCVAELRAALNDAARSPRFVETIPKRGYRFIAEVRRAEIGPAAVPAAREPAVPARWLRTFGWAAVVPLLIVQEPFRIAAHTRSTALPESLAAFEQAMHSSEAGGSEGRRRAIASLRLATRLDPRFAEAQYALADSYVRLAVDRDLPMDAAIHEAREAVERAVALEEAAESRAVLGTIRLIADWDWSGARREFARAIALEPGWDSAQVSYANVLSGLGDDAGAIAAIDRAEALSPNCDLILFDAGRIYSRAGRYDDAADKFARAIAFGPPHHLTAPAWKQSVGLRLLANALARTDWNAAHREAIAIVAESGAAPELQRAFAARPPRQAVEGFLRRSLAMLTAPEERRHVPPTRVAALHAMLGDADAAMAALEQAAREKDPDLVYVLRDPEFDILRALPRFLALDARVRRLPSRRGAGAS